MDEVGAKAHLQHAVIPQEILDKEKLLSETMRLKNAAAADQNFELAASYRDRECQLEDELQKLNKDWMQNDNGVRETIGEAEVATVVAQMSGIPVQKISESEEGMLRHLSDTLKSSVISQDKAIDKISRCIQRSRLGLKDPNKPIGVFMFLGPTGVGKTYLAQKLAETAQRTLLSA